MNIVRNTLIGGAVAVGVAGAVGYARRAIPKSAELIGTDYNSKSPSTQIAWSYGPGIEPQSVMIDVTARGSSGRIIAEGNARSARMPLSAPLSGSYVITVTASYLLYGVFPSTITRSYTGTAIPAAE